MSVLINLLPDTRQAKLRERRRRQLVTGIAVVVWIVAGGVVALLSLYVAGQKLAISNANKQIADKKQQLENVPGLMDALTAQQHLTSLPDLYRQRVYLTKFFAAYSEANPQDVALASMTLDATNQLVASGTAKSYLAAAKLARALEAEHVTIGKGAAAGNEPYFTNVALQTVTRANNQVSFTINMTVGAGATSGN